MVRDVIYPVSKQLVTALVRDVQRLCRAHSEHNRVLSTLHPRFHLVDQQSASAALSALFTFLTGVSLRAADVHSLEHEATELLALSLSVDRVSRAVLLAEPYLVGSDSNRLASQEFQQKVQEFHDKQARSWSAQTR